MLATATSQDTRDVLLEDLNQSEIIHIDVRFFISQREKSKGKRTRDLGGPKTLN